jgi:phage tail-like protein
MATTPRKNPYAAFNFIVTLTGSPPSPGGGAGGAATGGTSASGTSNSTIGGFMEVSGLDGENAIIEYRNGDDQNAPTGSGGSSSGSAKATGAFVRKQPGLERYPNVTLRRGIVGDLTLWSMRQAIRDATNGPEFATQLGSVQPSLAISLQDETHNTVMTWTLHNVWVSKLSGPALNAKANEVAIESVEFVCERTEITFPTS